jgi:hypothetical protein
VRCVSFHHSGIGFFPGEEPFDEAFEEHSCSPINIGLPQGVTRDIWLRAIYAVVPRVLNQDKPATIIIQCGVDGLAGDPKAKSAGWQLNHLDYIEAVAVVLACSLPDTRILLLGGGMDFWKLDPVSRCTALSRTYILHLGGYHLGNTAITWTHITALCWTWLVHESRANFIDSWDPDLPTLPCILNVTTRIRISQLCEDTLLLLPHVIPNEVSLDTFDAPYEMKVEREYVGKLDLNVVRRFSNEISRKLSNAGVKL